MDHTHLYWPKTVPTLLGDKVKVDEHFNHIYKEYKLYKIVKKRISDREARTINNENYFIMTGKQHPDALECQKESADDTNDQKKSLEFRKTKGGK